MSKRTTKERPYKNTQQLAFRLLTAAEEALYCQLYADPEVMRYIWIPLAKERALVSFGKALALTQQAHFQRRVTVIIERSSKAVIGFSHIHVIEGRKRTAIVGSMLTTAAQAKGYGPEYSKALIAHAFKYRPVDKLVAEVGVGNTVTEGLVKELGFSGGTKETASTPERPAYTTWTLTRGKWKKHNKISRK